jgi:hypothetical protein
MKPIAGPRGWRNWYLSGVLTPWGSGDAYRIDKMGEFAVRVMINPSKKYPEAWNFKEAVLSSPPYWELSSGP